MRTTRRQFWEKYQVVLFDCDDTLTQSIKVRSKALLHVAQELQIALTEEQIRAAWGKPFDSFIAQLFPGIAFEQFAERYEIAREQYKAVANAGVPQLLRYLAQQKKRLEIVTSSRQSIIVQDLTTIGIVSYFTEIWGHEQTAPYSKPDPKVLLPILTNLHKEEYMPEHILYIGDSLSDYCVAQGNGIDFIAVTTGLDSRDTFLEAGLNSECIKKSLSATIPLLSRKRLAA